MAKQDPYASGGSRPGGLLKWLEPSVVESTGRFSANKPVKNERSCHALPDFIVNLALSFEYNCFIFE